MSLRCLLKSERGYKYIADMMCVHQIYMKYVNAEVDTIGPCEVFSKRNVCGNRHDGCVSGI